MASLKDRQRMAVAILNAEAKRENGHLAVHKLPDIDGGGSYEVAGINEKNNKETADVLVALIEEERYDEAEALALDFIAQDTDRASSWSRVPAIEFYLRDCMFNRGAHGAARILQRALGVEDDGVVGAQTRVAIGAAESNPAEFLSKLRDAREQYERDVAKRDETHPFWKGLVNRWNNAVNTARSFPIAAPIDQPFPPEAPAAPAPPSPAPVAPSTVSAPPQFDSSAPATLAALRIGMRGDRVLAWQTFLVGKGFDNGPIDGFFGEHTRDATKEFQKKYKLEEDGVAGRTTLLKAAALGFELIEEPAEDNTSSNFPPRPNFPALMRDDQRAALFTRFDYVSAPTPDNPEAIRVLGNWAKENIITVPIPQLAKTATTKPPQTMQFHRLAAKQLQGLWQEWESTKLLNRIVSYDGSYVPRFIRGSRTSLSNHAFGTAFDINVRYNGLGRRPALVGETGCVRELVQIAHRWGFYWGGHFTRLDGMHFEVAFIKR